jgi:hypothetical protein
MNNSGIYKVMTALLMVAIKAVRIDLEWKMMKFQGLRCEGKRKARKTDHEENMLRILKKPHRQPPEMIGSVKLSSKEPRSIVVSKKR